MKKVRVFINGFGRIGRAALRVMLDDDAFDVVGINDVFDYEQFRYVLKYDSVYHRLSHTVALEENLMYVGRHKIRLFSEENSKELDIAALEIDVLLQCSGRALTMQENQVYLDKDVKRVVLSTPPQDSMPTFIMGYNHHSYKCEPIISNSSCSTNAIAPLMQLLDKHLGLKNLAVSMVHSYTNDQYLLDTKSSEFRRSRSATQNILPFESTATETLSRMFPHLKDKLYTKSIRVPITATTLYDFSFYTKTSTDSEKLRVLFKEHMESSLVNVIATDESQKVSTDYIGDRHSLTLDLPMIKVLDEMCIKIMGWQDNEYGYAYQLVQMAKVVTTTL